MAVRSTVAVVLAAVSLCCLKIGAVPIGIVDNVGEATGTQKLTSCSESANGNTYPSVLPLPSRWNVGSSANFLFLSPSFTFAMESAGDMLHGAFQRYKRLTFPHGCNNASASGPLLDGLKVIVQDQDATLELGVDESYELEIPSPDAPTPDGRLVATLTSVTQFGALRGLETFSQLTLFDFDGKHYYVGCVPWVILDKPRFPHRELMVDSSRHFLPVPTLKNVLLAMSFAKLNTLHWHIVDEQAFPMESKRNPLLSGKGAWSEEERYTTEDIKEVVAHAAELGIRVVPEIDMPGHAAAWCKGYPEICPSVECPQPLSPVHPTTRTPLAANATLDLIGRLLDDVLDMFPDAVIHLGGDEVRTDCWNKTASVAAWLRANRLSEQEALVGFLAEVNAMARARGRRVVCWDEVWATMGAQVPAGTVIQMWRGWAASELPRVIDAGYHVLWSLTSTWYLPHVERTWEDAWKVDICAGLTALQCPRVLGGGGEEWGERADTSNILMTIFPKLAGISEALWSPQQRMQTPGGDLQGATSRMASFRCLLNRRGVPAAPLFNPQGRQPPPGPGACLGQ